MTLTRVSPLSLVSTTIEVRTKGRGLYLVDGALNDWLATTKISQGLLHVFIRHTSASLLVQENADEDVLADMERFFARLVPDGDSMFRHVAEGPDDMPGHIRSALTQTAIEIPVEPHGQGCKLSLGVWQGVFVYEHRQQGRTRELRLSLLGG